MFRSSNKQSCHAPLRSTRFQCQQSSIANVQTLDMQILSACTTRVKDITVTCREQLPPSNNRAPRSMHLRKREDYSPFLLSQHHCERLIYKTAKRLGLSTVAMFYWLSRRTFPWDSFPIPLFDSTMLLVVW